MYISFVCMYVSALYPSGALCLSGDPLVSKNDFKTRTSKRAEPKVAKMKKKCDYAEFFKR